jgi:hypothetical protein
VSFQIHVSPGARLTDLHVTVGDGEAPFPSADWRDFPVVVLAWWLDDYRALRQQGSTVCSSFMNGPYAMRLSPGRDSESLVLDFLRRTTEGVVPVRASAVVPHAAYAAALSAAAETVASSTAPDDPDLPALTAAIAALNPPGARP